MKRPLPSCNCKLEQFAINATNIELIGVTSGFLPTRRQEQLEMFTLRSASSSEKKKQLRGSPGEERKMVHIEASLWFREQKQLRGLPGQKR
jgi:hypothetical protein